MPIVSGNPVVLWSNGAVSQLTVLWHPEQFARPKAGPADGCTGFVVRCHVVKWHPRVPAILRRDRQVVVVIDVQEAQGTLACPFVSRNPVALWSNLALSQVSKEWQVSQGAAKKFDVT